MAEPITRGDMLEWVDYKIEDVVYDLTQCSSPIEANTHKRDRAILQALRSLLLEPERRGEKGTVDEWLRVIKQYNRIHNNIAEESGHYTETRKSLVKAYREQYGDARGEGELCMLCEERPGNPGTGLCDNCSGWGDKDARGEGEETGDG